MKVIVRIEYGRRRRCWLKAIDSEGNVRLVQNIPKEAVFSERSKLLEELVASGLYEEVTGEPINGSFREREEADMKQEAEKGRDIRDALKVPAIAWRFRADNRATEYVESLPGEGGVDWGYTNDVRKARTLSPYWQKRFRAYIRDVSRHDSVGFREC